MRTEALLWSGVTVYFVAIAAIYALSGGSVEGGTLLLVGAAFGGLVAGWLWRWHRRHGARPSDLPDEVADTGAVGTFPASSLRPLGVAAGMSITALGVVLGSWMLAAGLALLASQVALIVRDEDAL